MKKLILVLLISSMYIGMVSCTPEVINDLTNSPGCCGNEGDLPPPPPPPPGG